MSGSSARGALADLQSSRFGMHRASHQANDCNNHEPDAQAETRSVVPATPPQTRSDSLHRDEARECANAVDTRPNRRIVVDRDAAHVGEGAIGHAGDVGDGGLAGREPRVPGEPLLQHLQPFVPVRLARREVEVASEALDRAGARRVRIAARSPPARAIASPRPSPPAPPAATPPARGRRDGRGARRCAPEFVKDRLATSKYPRWIEFAGDLPKTATGKIQRFKLQQ